MDLEFGHDRILTSALHQLGYGEEDWDVSPVTQKMIALFSHAAKTNFLAFVGFIDLFELDDFRHGDEFIEILSHYVNPEAASLLQKHSDIIRSQNHHGITHKLIPENSIVSMKFIPETYGLVDERIRLFGDYAIHLC